MQEQPVTHLDATEAMPQPGLKDQHFADAAAAQRLGHLHMGERGGLHARSSSGRDSGLVERRHGSGVVSRPFSTADSLIGRSMA